jgi:hypothetical protein
VLPLDSKQELFAEPFVGAFEKSALGKVTKCDVQTFACLGKVTKFDVQTFACLGKVTKCDVQTFACLDKVTKCDVQTFACFQASAAVQMRFALFLGILRSAEWYSLLRTFRDNLSGPRVRAPSCPVGIPYPSVPCILFGLLDPWRRRPIGCTKTSVRNYHSALSKIPKEGTGLICFRPSCFSHK